MVAQMERGEAGPAGVFPASLVARVTAPSGGLRTATRENARPRRLRLRR